MTTIAYIDGFNLYFGSLKHTPYKWLDVRELCRLHFPNDQFAAVRYFTARISGRGDPSKPLRQQAYLRAIATIPDVSIHYGSYLRTQATRPLVQPLPGGPGSALVWKDEEKGSDVNLACWMLLDAFDARCDTAVVVSNDSDLETPIKILRYRFGIKVGVLFPLNPQKPTRKASTRLVAAADFVETVRPGALQNSQLATQLADALGHAITKPAAW